MLRYGKKTNTKSKSCFWESWGWLQSAGLSRSHQINTHIYFPWVALLLRPLAHVREKLQHIGGACLQDRGQGSRREVVEPWSNRAVRRLAVCKGQSGHCWAGSAQSDGVPGPTPDQAEFPSAGAILCYGLSVCVCEKYLYVASYVSEWTREREREMADCR